MIAPRGGLALGALALALTLTALPPRAAQVADRATPAAEPLYRRAGAPVAARVRALLGRMVLAEKVGQMTLISVQDLLDCAGSTGPPQQLHPACLQRFLGHDLVGNVLSGGGQVPLPNTPRSWADLTNGAQRYAVTHTRLGIPILYGVDAVHGHNNVLGATIFPHNLGMAASWDPALVQAEEQATAAAVLATGIHWTYAPDADLARDIRWGRYYETFGEDPFLAAQMVGAAVRGFQGSTLATHVAATAKHFMGYSQPLTGADRAFGEMSVRTLREDFAPSFQAAIDGGAGAVMAQSGSINGVPVHASHYLLTDVLRGQMGFRGVLVTDWQDIQALYDVYHVAPTYKEAIRQAIMAGIDMSMVPYDSATFTADLIALVREGRVPLARVDQAVDRILTLKFRLGLFDHPYVDPARANALLGAHRALARQAAGETMTLLKNDGGLLPLPPTLRSILVAGGPAESVADQMGGWTLDWQGVPSGAAQPPATTVLQGIREQAGQGTRVTYVASDPAAAARAARAAGVAIVVVGEGPYAEGFGNTQTAALPDDQRALVRAVEATGTPVVLVVIAGRPLIIADLLQGARSLLMAYLPGTEGGHAVAGVLFGAINPSGHLPVSWPRTIGQEPLFYTFLPGTTNGPGATYDPLFPFGYGLGYTTFAQEDLRVDPTVGRQGTANVWVTVRNTARRAGDDVVQVYVHPEDSAVVVPPRQLVAFARVHLQAGQSRTVTLALPASRLAAVPGDIPAAGRPVVAPGHYTIMSSAQSAVLTVR